MRRARNRIGVYTWGQSNCCVDRGATSATLVDPGQVPVATAPKPNNDECAAPGRLYGCLRRHQLAPAWFTTGPEVPSDIAVATADALVDRLFATAAVAV